MRRFDFWLAKGYLAYPMVKVVPTDVSVHWGDAEQGTDNMSAAD